MSLAIQSFVANRNPPATPRRALFTPIHLLSPKLPPFLNSRTNFPIFTLSAPQSRLSPVRKIKASFDQSFGASKSLIDDFNFDGLLHVLEFLCLASSAAISVYVALSDGFPKLGILVWQFGVLASAAAIGAVIRRRQWRRLSGGGFSEGSGSRGANLLGRVEKLEEDLRSSATIIRVLSRQVEKLGIRVRVTRKTLKEPIAEMAALAQKNSEATRALAAQEDILEKELCEIQKVLLAMQEQQRKQLELILAIGKAGKLWENEHLLSKDPKASPDPSKSSADRGRKLDINPTPTPELQKQTKAELS
ncbi:uncharacterized protein LOC127241918 [Andrographis paniculata]|uniref:uncharacterized protein LOC127241918 n=1 Tax=Andrographis paniculata TaxID=175694 RepID=UPI0021E93681|nr:uncharacterized protein LOC127241918 [Andrographis paniculata]